ncbi:DUF2497 domain-containing protein [Rhodopila sp.]|uniref:DUF2497 domain-containing protein n=1 Tax=Rhodopila sp. TaxID=2480087 RepID=UPI003D0D4EC4
MEEILASIRRILNDDDAPAEPPSMPETPASDKPPSVDRPPALGKPPALDKPTMAEPPPADDDVLLLDQSMMISQTAAADHPAASPQPALPVRPAPAPLEAEPLQQENEALTTADPFDPLIPGLVAPEAAAAAASSVGSLVRTLAAGRATQVYAGGPTLEDIVRAELRPLLKEWLDTNLPPMVERLVRTEIERVVGRATP